MVMTHRAMKERVPSTDHADDDATATGAPSDEQARAAAATFAMLADPTRLKLLWLLGRDELDVATLAGQAGTTPSVASQHLAKLRLAGLVRQRVDGRHRLYTASGTHLKALIREALYLADHDVTGVPDHG